MPPIKVKRIPGLTAPYWDLSEYFLSLDGDQTLTPEQVAAIIASLGLGTLATQDEGTGAGDFRDNAANDARFVQLTGDQNIGGVKTFTSGLSIAMADPQWVMTDTSDGNKAVAISLIGNIFVIAADRDGDGTVEAPLPLLLNSDNNTAQFYGSLAYTRANILGTVGQSSGVPTGAIIERGNSANGEYVRFADGTQICWSRETSGSNTVTAAGSVFRTGSNVWVFPSSFAEEPSIAGVQQRSPGYCWFAEGASIPSTTRCSWAVFSPISSANAPVAGIIAIGRWF